VVSLTTGYRSFAECQGHSAKPQKHSTNGLPSIFMALPSAPDPVSGSVGRIIMAELQTLPLNRCCCLEAESVSFFEFVLEQEKINLQRLLTAVLSDRVLTSAPCRIVYMCYDNKIARRHASRWRLHIRDSKPRASKRGQGVCAYACTYRPRYVHTYVCFYQ